MNWKPSLVGALQKGVLKPIVKNLYRVASFVIDIEIFIIFLYQANFLDRTIIDFRM